MAVVPVPRANAFQTDSEPRANLSTAQTGNGDSTNIAHRGLRQEGGAVVITSSIGGSPTVTVNIQGSVDGVAWFNIPYALVATPRTFVLTAITITTAVTTTYILQELIPFRFVKLVYSANTNVTLTADAYLQMADDLAAKGKPRMVSIEAVVIRADGSREDLGTVSYWHKNPLRRWAWRIKRAL